MYLIAIHLHVRLHLLHLSVNAGIEIALAAQALEEFTVMALTAFDYGGEDEYLPAGIVVHNHLYDLLLGVFHHRLARHVAISLAGTGKEQSQVVIDLRRRAYGRTRVLVGGLLFYADDRRQARNAVHIGAFQSSQEVADVGREGLDIAALSLGIDGVEGQGRLSRAAEAGDDGQRVARNLYVDVLEIVYAGSEDLDFFPNGLNGVNGLDAVNRPILRVVAVFYHVEVAHQVHVALDFIFYAVSTTCLHIDVVDAVFHGMTVIRAVPAAVAVVPVGPVI